MKSIIKNLWMLISLLCTYFSASAYDFEINNIHYTKLSSNTCTVESYFESYLLRDEIEITIPSEVVFKGSTYKVVSIEDRAFSKKEKITAINLPETIESIGTSCFKGCVNLSSINIPSGITTLNSECFSGCYSLTSISIPETITEIGSECFNNCSGLSYLSIPNSVKLIGNHAFAGCTSLSSVELPNSIEKMDYGCFRRCSALKIINIPISLQNISDYCFNGCTSIKSMSIPDNVKVLGNGAFDGCTELSSIRLNKNLTDIGTYCFARCSNLSVINIPNSITTLKEGCFFACKNLAQINIPETIANIGAQCFSSSGLTYINIPETVNRVGLACFRSCQQLKKAIVKSSTIDLQCFNSCPLEYLYLGAIPLHDEYYYQGINTDTLVISSKIRYLNLGIYVSPQSHASTYYADLLNDTPTKIVFEDSVDTLQIGWGYRNSDTYNKSDNIYYSNSASTFHWGYGYFDNPTTEIYLGRPLQGCEMDTRGVEVLTLGPQLRKFQLGSEIESISQLPSLKQLNSLNPNPPIIGNPTETQYENVKVTVPAEFLSAYQNDPIWKGFWNITGIADLDEDIEIDKQYKVYTSGGSICVEADSSDTVEIYTLQGIAVYSGKGSIRHEVPSGVYIVRVNGHATKLLVR
ncbi:MAG: leucine-rich repeat protein [Muribaculaceae bacterium]